MAAKSGPGDILLRNRDEKKKSISIMKLVEKSTKVSILRMMSKENHVTSQ